MHKERPMTPTERSGVDVKALVEEVNSVLRDQVDEHGLAVGEETVDALEALAAEDAKKEEEFQVLGMRMAEVAAENERLAKDFVDMKAYADAEEPEPSDECPTERLR